MAKIQCLIIGHCFGAQGSEPDSDNQVFFHKKGTIVTFDDKKKEDVATMTSLFAAGRIVPPEKKNLVRCKAEIQKEIDKQARDAARDKVTLTKAQIITIPEDIDKALADLAAAERAGK
jgi:hypothetical protein